MRIPRHLCAFGFATILSLGVNSGFCPTACASGVVTSPTQSSLAAAMAGGGTVTFAFSGTIYLTNTITVSNNTVLDATGETVAISGSNAVQIFIVNTNTSLTLTNLTLENGWVQATLFYSSPGAAIWNKGVLQIAGCSFINNVAEGISLPEGFPVDGDGGAIYNTGTMMVSNSQFSGNAALGGSGNQGYHSEDLGNGGNGNGGALFNLGQAACISCVFSNNSAIGGGGASTAPENVDGSPGCPGGAANGGAICNSGPIVIFNCTFDQNIASGGQGGAGDPGENYYDLQAGNGGNGGSGGNAAGGGFCCLGGSAALDNDTFWLNSAVGAAGGAGGVGGATVHDGPPAGTGGTGGNGGDATGGAIGFTGGILLVTNFSDLYNPVTQGAGGAGGPGGAGSLFDDPPPGAPGVAGSPGTDEGDYQYVSGYLVSGAVSGFTLATEVRISAGSIHITTTNHGYYSLQLPYPGSYTITPSSASYLFIPSSITVTEYVQSNVNFQAYRWNNLSLDSLGSGVAHLAFASTNSGTYRTLASSDLVHWSPVATNAVSAGSDFQVAVPANAPQGEFYKAVSP